MAKIYQVKAISPEEVKNADMLSQYLTDFAGSVSDAMDGKLTFKENMQCDIRQITLTTKDDWESVTTFINSWLNYDNATYNAASYMKDGNGLVYLRGLIKDGTVNTGGTGVAFVLPAALRPARTLYFPVASNGAYGTCQIDSSGNVKAYSGNSAWFSLEGIFFAASDRGMDENDVFPIEVKHKLSTILFVKVGSCIDATEEPRAQDGVEVSWTIGKDNTLRVKNISGLTPGRSYKINLVIVGA